MTTVGRVAIETEGRRGSQTRVEEGGRYLGIPPDRSCEAVAYGRVGDEPYRCLIHCPRNRVRYTYAHHRPAGRPAAVLAAAQSRVLDVLASGVSVVVVDSAGAERTARVCEAAGLGVDTPVVIPASARNTAKTGLTTANENEKTGSARGRARRGVKTYFGSVGVPNPR